MAGTTTRALALLNLLQTHRSWTGPELAERLGVSDRTLRRDVERLRELGYRIESAPGADGGYRLEAGSAVPPLLLTDEEAVTMAVGLRLAAIQRLAGGPETSLSALAKLEQVLPAHLRRKVAAMAAFQPVGPEGPLVAPEVLGELALACRDHERLRFAYVAADGSESRRHVEPHTVVPAERAWYLLAWDVHREDWRTFRVERMDEVRRTGGHFSPRTLDDEEASQHVWSAASSYTEPAVSARAVLDLPLEATRDYFGPWARGAEAVDEHRTAWPMGGKEARELPFALVWIPAGVSYVLEADEDVRAELHEIAQRLLEATAPPEASGDGAS